MYQTSMQADVTFKYCITLLSFGNSLYINFFACQNIPHEACLFMLFGGFI